MAPVERPHRKLAGGTLATGECASPGAQHLEVHRELAGGALAAMETLRRGNSKP